MHSHIVAYVVCVTLAVSAARSEGTEASKDPAVDVYSCKIDGQIVECESVWPCSRPATDPYSCKIDGQIVEWDFTLHAHAPKMAAQPAGSGLVEFVDVGSPQRAIAVALAQPTLTADGQRTSLQGRTEIGERFSEGYYITTLKYRGGEAAEAGARLGVLVVKHRRQFISFIPDNPKYAAYPPEICAWTDEIKQAQREAGTRLMKEIETAVKEGKKKFTFPFRFTGSLRASRPPRPHGSSRTNVIVVAVVVTVNSTSSKPPSSDIVKPKKPLLQGGKKWKKGGQPGHEQHLRSPFPPEAVNEFLPYTLDCCG